MKKETRVKDLPKILLDKITNDFITEGSDEAKYFLDRVDWTKSTDAERLAYCEFRYPNGTKFKCCSGWKEILTSSGTFEVGEPNSCYYGYIHNKNSDATLGCYGVVYLHGKFAEIIEEVEKVEPSETKPNPQSIKDRLKGTCVLNEKEGMGAEIVALYEEGGIINFYGQAGIVVDSYYGESGGYITCYTDPKVFPNGILTLDQLREIVRGEKQPESTYKETLKRQLAKEFSDTEPVEFKEGEMVEYNGINSIIIHIYDGMAWIKNADQRLGRLVYLNELSKIDQDKERVKQEIEELKKRIQDLEAKLK